MSVPLLREVYSDHTRYEILPEIATATIVTATQPRNWQRGGSVRGREKFGEAREVTNK